MYGKELLHAILAHPYSAQSLIRRALEKGLLMNASRLNRLRFMSALTVLEKEVDRMIAILEEVLHDS